MLKPDDLEWRGRFLYRRGSRSGRPLIGVEAAGARHPGMWRIYLPSGRLSDMLNRTMARDTAVSIMLAGLNARGALSATRAEQAGNSRASRGVKPGEQAGNHGYKMNYRPPRRGDIGLTQAVRRYCGHLRTGPPPAD